MRVEFESHRLNYRPLQEADIDVMTELWTDPEITKYVADEPMSLVELNVGMPLACQRGGDGCIGIWLVTNKLSGQKLGTIFLLPMPTELDDTDWNLVKGENIPFGDIEIGFIFKKDAWGKGHATEACQRLLQYAFEDTPLNVIRAVVEPENIASLRVLSKSGMKDIGEIRAYNLELPAFEIDKRDWLSELG